LEKPNMKLTKTVIVRGAAAFVGATAIAVIPLLADSGVAAADPGIGWGRPGPGIGGWGGPRSGLGLLPGAGFGLPGPGLL
jgi:hypothetical protein